MGDIRGGKRDYLLFFNLGLPILSMTDYAAPEDSTRCLAAGCNDVLTKPVKKQQLLKILNKYL